jgi:hypothetical protein
VPAIAVCAVAGGALVGAAFVIIVFLVAVVAAVIGCGGCGANGERAEADAQCNAALLGQGLGGRCHRGSDRDGRDGGDCGGADGAGHVGFSLFCVIAITIDD